MNSNFCRFQKNRYTDTYRAGLRFWRVLDKIFFILSFIFLLISSFIHQLVNLKSDKQKKKRSSTYVTHKVFAPKFPLALAGQSSENILEIKTYVSITIENILSFKFGRMCLTPHPNTQSKQHDLRPWKQR